MIYSRDSLTKMSSCALLGALSVFAASASAVGSKSIFPWQNATMYPVDRASALLAEMTIEEKIMMLHGGSSSNYVGYVEGNSRLGIPPLNLADGPQGFRDDSHVGTTTSFPSGLTVGATWDSELCWKWGAAMGEEFYNKGANVQLGPGLNIARVPLNGRNFEYMSGGDSFLGYTLVQPVVRGIQSQKVIANAKHWVENNQETDRDTVSENVDERTRHELYYRPFAGFSYSFYMLFSMLIIILLP